MIIVEMSDAVPMLVQPKSEIAHLNIIPVVSR